MVAGLFRDAGALSQAGRPRGHSGDHHRRRSLRGLSAQPRLHPEAHFPRRIFAVEVGAGGADRTAAGLRVAHSETFGLPTPGPSPNGASASTALGPRSPRRDSTSAFAACGTIISAIARRALPKASSTSGSTGSNWRRCNSGAAESVQTPNGEIQRRREGDPGGERRETGRGQPVDLRHDNKRQQDRP